MGETEKDESTLRTKFGKHISAGLVATILIRGIGILVVKVLTNLLSKTDYGSYSLWLALAVFASMVSTSPFSASIWRFMQKRSMDDKKSASRLISTSILGSFMMLSIVFICIFLLQAFTNFLGVADSSYSITVVVIIILTSFFILKELILVISGSEQNAREILSYNLAYGLLSSGLACLVAFLIGDYRLVLIGLIIGYSIPVLVSLYIKLKQYGISKPKGSDFKQVLEYGSPYVVTSAAVNSFSFVTSFFVALWVGLSAVATLAIALTLSGLLSLVIGPMMMAYRAYITNAFETGNLERGNVLSTKLVVLFAVFAAPAIWFLVRLSSFLIELVSTNEYMDAAILLPFALISVLMLNAAGFWRFRLDLAKKTHLTASIYFSGVIALVVSCLVLIPLLGLIGVGIAMVLHAAVILILIAISGNSFLPIQLKRYIGGVWCFSVVLMISADIVLQFMGVPDLISLALSGIIYGIAVFSTKLLRKNDIRTIINHLIGY